MDIYKYSTGNLVLVRWQSRSWSDDKIRPYVVNGGYYLEGEEGSLTLTNPLGEVLTYVCPASSGKNYSEILSNVAGQLI